MADIPKKKYKNNYLTQVIYQLTFENNETISDDSLKKYKDSLGESYAGLANVKQQGIIIHNDGSKINTETEDSFIWQIESSAKDHMIIVSKNSFAINFGEYVRFREYVKTISKAQEEFFKIFPQTKQINRLGLRYVNQIKLNKTDVNWSDYISPLLTDSLKFIDQSKLRRSMHSIVFAHDETTQVNMNYGIYNQFFPAPIVDNIFIIDLDAYTPVINDVNECSQILKRFNKIIAIYFEMSIQDKLRSEMEVLDDNNEQ